MEKGGDHVMLNLRRESLCRIYSFILSQWRVYEEFEDTIGVIIIHKSTDRQHNDQKKRDNIQYTKHTHKTKDRVTRTPLRTEVCSGTPER